MLTQLVHWLARTSHRAKANNKDGRRDLRPIARIWRNTCPKVGVAIVSRLKKGSIGESAPPVEPFLFCAVGWRGFDGVAAGCHFRHQASGNRLEYSFQPLK